MKRCRICKEAKPATDFTIDRVRPSGRHPYCKECNAAKQRERMAKNAARKNVKIPDEKKCYVCQKIKAGTEYAKNRTKPDGLRAICKSCLSVQRKEIYKETRETFIAKVVQWQKDNPKKVQARFARRKARERNAPGSLSADQWEKLLEFYAPDSRCLACGKKTSLQIDHVIALANGGTNYADNIQPICKSCNCSKNSWHNTDYRPDSGAFAQGLM